MFFSKVGDQPCRTIPAQTVSNSSPWTKIPGKYVKFVDISQHYLCALVTPNSDDVEECIHIEIYHLGEWGIKRVFT